MKRIFMVALVLLAAIGVGNVAAQSEIADLSVFVDSFESFSEEFAKSLPMNSTIGLNWSDAYIGQFLAVPPHFGVGVTAGVTTVPSDVFDSLIDDLGIVSSSGVGDLTSFGLPVPGYAFDARVGGIAVPFDAGIKIGVLPAMSLGDVDAEYTNIGFDVRYAVLDGGVVMPKLSVGVGYNRLSGRIAAPLGPSATTIASIDDPSTTGTTEDYNLVLTNPNLASEWTSNVIDFKVQLSKSFLVVEPHIGLGASYGISTVTSGIEAGLEVQDSGGAAVAGVDPADLAAAGAAINADGVTVESDVNAFAFRVFGGASVNILIMRFDLGLMYNINSGAMGATLGGRVQI